MMHETIEKLLDETPPAWLRTFEAAALMGVFAQAFEVKAPATEDLSAEQALALFREFTAACMDIALEDEEVAAFYRTRLGQEACAFGRKLRRALPLSHEHAVRLVRYLYRGIGIELAGELPGDVRFGPCSFAQRYSPGNCWLMSAFDEGFICAMLGVEGALQFDCRLTEGAACCRARLEPLPRKAENA